jgi:hypothetical protein
MAAKARRLDHTKRFYENGDIVEIKLWEVPSPVPGSKHLLKYSLFYGNLLSGQRIVGYDNERGKGDHKHIQGVESPYQFIDLHTLVEDFFEDVLKFRSTA